jgi:DNA-binding response OmpR family regulator
MDEMRQMAIDVLLVDDDPTEFEIIKYKLENMDSHNVHMDYASSLDGALDQIGKKKYSIILMDNMLFPHGDFRQTVPEIRKAKYIGPIGIISSDISGGYFQSFGEYGADFRMAKQEIDARSLRYIFTEYTKDNSVPFDDAW